VTDPRFAGGWTERATLPAPCRFAPGTRERLEAEIVTEEAEGRVNTAAVLRRHLAETYPTPALVDPDAD
jgi:hypothetical protein